MPGTFRSKIQLTQPDSASVRTTIPEGVAKALDAVPDGTLVWVVDLKAGRVTVNAEPPPTGSPSAKSKRRS